MKKNTITNAILAANDGLDSERALGTAHDIMKYHDLCQPVLYHLVLTGATETATYRKVIKALVRRLRDYGCRVEYFGAFEAAEDKGGIHAHCFVLIETSKKFPKKIMNVNDGEYLHDLAVKNNLVNKDGSTARIHVAKPKNAMHGGEFFARPVVEGGKLEDCMKWCTYVFKSRSKDAVPGRETYFNSEFKANKERREATKFRTNKKPEQPSTTINV